MRKGKADTERGGSSCRMRIQLDTEGGSHFSSGSGFMDHMLLALARLGGMNLEGEAKGLLHREYCIGVALGSSLDQALGDRAGIRRYGWALVPMDEALGQVALDLSGRSCLVIEGSFRGMVIADQSVQGIEAFLEGLSVGGRITLNVIHRGENDHHKAEALFKALGLALAMATAPGRPGVLSTKGII